MKLFQHKTPTPVAPPESPREPLTSDPDVLSTIWAVWLAAQPLQDQQVLARRHLGPVDAALARQIAEEPTRKLRRLETDPAMEPEVRAFAEGLLAGELTAEVPPRLGWVADTSELERTLTRSAIKDTIQGRMTAKAADTMAFVIAFLVGTEWGAADVAPRRLAVARGVIFVTLRDLGLPIHTWEARLVEAEQTPPHMAKTLVVYAA
jgi:hypothetical protein